MPRIAKSAINGVFAEAADRLLQAGGPDGIVSRDDMKKAIASAPTEKERAFTALFAGYVDHRDHKAGARVTGADIRSGLQKAATTQVERLDGIDGGKPNGLSASEIAQGSNSVKLAVAIIQERAAAAKAAKAEPQMAQSAD